MAVSFDSLLATDAEIALLCTQDYPGITPNAWRLAQGTDGSATGLAFSSVAVNFETYGVVPGMVLGLGESSKPRGDLLEITAVSGTSLTLKRLGMDAGVGMGPTLASGVANYTFEVPTCYAAIAEATATLRAKYGASASSDLLRHACRLTVLCRLYGAAHQLAGLAQETGDNYRAKYRQYKAELDAVTATLDATYGPTPDDSAAPASGPRRRPAIGFTADQSDWPLSNGLWDR